MTLGEGQKSAMGYSVQLKDSKWRKVQRKEKKNLGL